MKKMLCTGVLAGVLFFSANVEASVSSYEVKSGDTLWLISQNYGVSVEELTSLNNLSGHVIYPGQTLTLQANSQSSKYTVQQGDSLWTISNKYGVTVSQLKSWNQLNSSAIYSGQSLVVSSNGQVESMSSIYSQAEQELLARLVHAESKGEPYKGQVAVAAVVLNRINHNDFPDTINGVIYETFASGTIFAFEPVQNGAIRSSSDEVSRKAVQDAINGYDPTNGAIYFFNPDTATSSWVDRLTINQRIGNHVFAL